MKVIKHDLPDYKELRILPLADLHVGDIHSDFKKVQEWLTYIKENENVYCILNGDLMDAAIKSSIGDIYGASLQPMQQLKHCVSIFEPIKDKCLCVTAGNHENRIYKSDGLDLTQLFCNQLGIGDLYSPASAVVFVRFGHNMQEGHGQLTYSIFCSHGNGNGRMEGGKVNRLVQLANIVDTDIYIHSHTHLPAIVKTAFYRTHPNNCSVRKVDKLFINTASSLEYGGYGEVQNYKPNSLDTPLIILDGRHRNMKALL